MLDLAARAAWRGAGRVEPNPVVGCVIAREERGECRVIGIGHHRVFGGDHAEVEALADCAARGQTTVGATAYVTLEPCNGQGRHGACVDALLRAGITSVVYARRDANPLKAGGAERLAGAGVDVRHSTVSVRATRLADPFVKRVVTGLPYVIAKWAQSIDGKIAMGSGSSQWISGERSRRRVHLLRARVDAIVTGIGTVKKDRPRLTARGVSVRRVARRVVIDPHFELADLRLGESLAADLPRVPLIIATGAEQVAGEAKAAQEWAKRGAEVLVLPKWFPVEQRGIRAGHGGLDVRELLEHLRQRHDASNVLIEAGPSTVGRFLRADLVDELQVYVGPLVIGDAGAAGPADGLNPVSLIEARRFELYESRVIGGDVRLSYRRPLGALDEQPQGLDDGVRVV